MKRRDAVEHLNKYPVLMISLRKWSKPPLKSNWKCIVFSYVISSAEIRSYWKVNRSMRLTRNCWLHIIWEQRMKSACRQRWNSFASVFSSIIIKTLSCWLTNRRCPPMARCTLAKCLSAWLLWSNGGIFKKCFQCCIKNKRCLGKRGINRLPEDCKRIDFYRS